eukprot:3730608-Amphidinium_carterae.9
MSSSCIEPLVAETVSFICLDGVTDLPVTNLRKIPQCPAPQEACEKHVYCAAKFFQLCLSCQISGLAAMSFTTLTILNAKTNGMPYPTMSFAVSVLPEPSRVEHLQLL